MSYVNWDDWKHLFGKMPDREIATIVGCDIKSVYSARRRSGIKLRNRCKPIVWTKADHLLGKINDEEIAEILKCDKLIVTNRRNKKHVPHPHSYPWTDEDSYLNDIGKQKCVECFEIKSVLDYYKNKKKKITNGTTNQRVCKICWQKRTRSRKITIKKQHAMLLGGCCQNCGFYQYTTSFHFHHVGEKLFAIADRLYKFKNKTDIVSELDKCCLLCANCHIAYHSGEIFLNFEKSDFGWKVVKT